ncbi:C4-dicarboxylate ABC transporter substrate-binding protein [Spirochaetia bacterium]|nr:C4-dicarboxylate ABC transporter substrate-binding protein [Spirochaetia bacterium]
MKKTAMVAALLVVPLVMALASGGGQKAGSGEKKAERLRLATGGNTGTYYAYGSAFGQIVQNKTGISVIIQSTGASKANIQLIQAGEVEIALVQNDVMDYAYKGIDLFNGQKITDFQAVAALYAEACQVVADPSKGIKTIADLKGKNVSVGDAGSGVEFNANQILAGYGIGPNDFNRQNLSFGASADALRDGKIDAFFCVAGAPTTAVMDLAINKTITLLEIDDAHADAIIKQYPFYTKLAVPGNSYRGNPTDVQTLTIKATLIASPKVDADTIYALTKTLFENKAEITAAHIKGAELESGYAVSGISVPFHPGAEKYFKETGALK